MSSHRSKRYVCFVLHLFAFDGCSEEENTSLKNRRDPIEPTVHGTVPREQNREHLENRTRTRT